MMLAVALMFTAWGACEGIALQPSAPDQVRTAVCFAGQFRAFSTAYPGAVKHMVRALPNADVFMFINMQDSGRGGNLSHTDAELAPIMDTMNVISVKKYDYVNDYLKLRGSLPKGGECFEKKDSMPLTHFSYHGPQFWTINQCYEMVKEHERQHGFKYNAIVRTRPDVDMNDVAEASIKEVNQLLVDPTKKFAWMKPGPDADMFAILTRSAAEAYFTAFTTMMAKNQCSVLPPGDICLKEGGPGVPPDATECFLFRALIHDGVEVRQDLRLAGLLQRPGCCKQWTLDTVP